MEVIYEEDNNLKKNIDNFKTKLNDVLEIIHIVDVNDYMKNKTYMSGDSLYDYIYDFPYNYVKNMSKKQIYDIIMNYGFNKAIKRLYKYYEDKLTDTNWEFCENIKHNQNIDYQIVVIILKDKCNLLF